MQETCGYQSNPKYTGKLQRKIKTVIKRPLVFDAKGDTQGFSQLAQSWQCWYQMMLGFYSSKKIISSMAQPNNPWIKSLMLIVLS